MKFTSVAVAAIMAGVASAHTTITNIYVNDVDQGLGNSAAGYIRSPPNNNPVKDITSSDMTCNVNNVATAKTVSVAAGDKITFEWHHNSNDASDDIIDASHKGPIITYIAPTSSNGAGDVWIKLAEEGFDGSEWAVTKLIANKGKHSITLPTSLTAGTYLLRPEIIALHEADVAFNVNSARGAQFYMECVQIEVTSGGSTELPTGVAIPGAYSYADPGIVFNLYGSFTSYTIPGPAVYDGTSGSDSSVVSTSSATQVASTSSVAQAVASSVAVTSAVATSTSISVQVTTSAVASVVQSTTVLSAVPTTLSTRVKCSKVSTASTVSTTSTSSSGTVAKWAQCGGTGYTGVTACVSGTTCQVQNPYYSQCL